MLGILLRRVCLPVLALGLAIIGTSQSGLLGLVSSALAVVTLMMSYSVRWPPQLPAALDRALRKEAARILVLLRSSPYVNLGQHPVATRLRNLFRRLFIWTTWFVALQDPEPDRKQLPAWIVLGVFVATFATYAAAIPHFLLYSSPPVGDQASYLMIATSLVQDRDLDLANQYANHEEDRFYSLAPHPEGFVGMSAPYPLRIHGAVAPVRPATESYSFHLPGLPLLLAPAWIIGSAFSLWWPATIVTMCALGALLSVNIFILAYEISGRRLIASLTWLPLAFANPLWTYSLVIFPEIAAALLLIYSLRRLTVAWMSNTPLRLILIGMAIAFLPWLSTRYWLISLTLAAYFVAAWRTRSRPAGHWGHVFGPVVVSALMLIAYNWFIYGRPFPPPNIPEVKDLLPFVLPWTGLDDLQAFARGGLGMLFDRQAGLLILAPIYALSLGGLAIGCISRDGWIRRLAMAACVVAGPYLLLTSAYVFWNGSFAPPARMVTVVAPLAAIGLALLLASAPARSATWGVYLISAGVGEVIMAVMLYDPRTMWPTGSPLGWLSLSPAFPFHAQNINLLDLLPSFTSLFAADESARPRQLAAALAGAGLTCGICLWANTRRPAAWALSSRPPRATSVAAISLLFGGSLLGWYLVNMDEFAPKNQIVEIVRWPIRIEVTEARGAAFSEGLLFVADIGNPVKDGGLIALDTTNGATSRITATSPGDEVVIKKPGDVKISPGGAISVLNNDLSANGIVEIKPDGAVERVISLPGKTLSASGFAFASDGSIYLSDFLGGDIKHYSPDGMQALPLQASARGLNNPDAVWVDGQDRFYAAMSGEQRVLQYSDTVGPPRVLRIKCNPFYAARDGRWLDIACGQKGIVSLDTESGRVTRSHFTGQSGSPGSARGVAYGPDGTFYTIDNDKVVGYRITRPW